MRDNDTAYLLAPEEQALEPGTKPGAGALFARMLKDNGYVWLAALASAGLMLFVWFCMGAIPFGGKTVLRIDLFHQYGPLFAELYDRIVGLRSLVYSWNTGLGGNFLGNFYNYLSSPTLLLTLLFGHENIPEAIGMMVLVKCAAASGAFAYFISKVFKKSDAAVSAFGILYSFCGFFIAYYWNVMWIDAMVLLPLVALGIHMIVHKRKFLLYTLALAGTLVTNYYMGFMMCIFSVLFFLTEMVSGYEPPAADNEQAYADEAKEQRRNVFQSYLAFGAGSLLAGALAAFALVPTFFAVRACSAFAGDMPAAETFQPMFNIFDFIINHFANMRPTIFSSQEPLLPNVYAGVAAVLLVPLYLIVPSKFIKPREKVAYTALLGLLFFSLAYKPLNFIWHAMHVPNDLPFRFSLFYSFILLYMAFRAFQHLKEIPARSIVTAGGAAALLLVIAERIGHGNLQPTVEQIEKAAQVTPPPSSVYINIAFIAAYTLLFYAISRANIKKQSSMALLLFCCVLTEVCAADTMNFDISQDKINYTVDYQDFQKVKSDILAQDDSFFRMEQTDLRTLMDPAWFDYRGISTFSSMAYEKTANLQYRLGMDSNFINSYSYNPQTPVYNAMHNLKYLVENQNFDLDQRLIYSFRHVLNPEFYTRRDEFTRARFTVFENKYPLSLGYFVDNAVKDWATENSRDPFVIQGDYWRLASGVPDVFTPLAFDIGYDHEEPKSVAAHGAGTYVNYSGKSDGQEGVIALTLHVEQAQNAYIYIDEHHINAVRVDRPNRTDGSTLEYRHDKRILWDLGEVKPEEPLSVKIYIKEDGAESGGFNVYTYGLNMDAFQQGYDVLKQNMLNITSFSDTEIKGTINAPKNGLMYTSIPYDKGWKVYVDGKRVNKNKLVAIGDYEKENATPGGLLGVPLKKGEHQIVMKFEAQGLREGMLITGTALLLLALCGILLLLRRRKQEKEQEAAKEPIAAGPVFATEGLSPEAFSLDVDFEGDEELLPLPEPTPAPLMAAPPAEEEEEYDDSLPTPEELAGMEEYSAEFSPEELDEILKEITPIEETAPPPEGVMPAEEAPSASAMLLEMQVKAEELRRKMHAEPTTSVADEVAGDAAADATAAAEPVIAEEEPAAGVAANLTTYPTAEEFLAEPAADETAPAEETAEPKTDDKEDGPKFRLI